MDRSIGRDSSLLRTAGRRGVILLLIATPLLLLACGGESAGNEGAADRNREGDRGAAAAASGGSLGDAPPPGTARIEVDGRVHEAPMRGCVLGGSGALVSARVDIDGEPYDLGLNGQRVLDAWTAQAGLTPAANGPTYLSSNGDVTVEGESVLYVGKFSKTSDGGSTEDVGEGRLSATCE